MLKLRDTLILASFVTATAYAQETTVMNVGYCSDESTDAVGLNEKTLNMAAVYFDSDFLAHYAGNRVKSISIQLGASFGSTGDVFVATSLDDVLPGAVPTPGNTTIAIPIPDFDYAPCYKWIDVPLTEELIVDADRPFYAGIRIEPYKSAPYYGKWQFAIDENEEGAKHCYIYNPTSKAWDPIMNHTFEECVNPNFLIRLQLEGSSLPVNDVAVTDLIVSPYMRTSETTSCTATIYNKASNVVSQVAAQLLLDGAVAETKRVTFEHPIAMKESATITFDDAVAFSNEGTHTVGVKVVEVEGVGDTQSSDNMMEREMSVVDRYFDHVVLAEAFTTMSCANCPGAHEREDKAFEGVTNVVRVDHHSGFGTDVLTTEADRAFTWFYNNGGTTYAPGMMFDRAMIDDFFDTQRSPGEEHSPIVGPGDPDNILFIHNHLAALPAFVDVNIDAEYNPTTRDLSITVSGEIIARLEGDNPAINVWLTESGLSAADNPRYGQMTGSGQPDMTFVHNNAMRQTLTGNWGKSIPATLAPYSYTFKTKLDAGWVAQNMQIVAFVANYDSEHPDNCRVHNSAALDISSLLNDADGVVAPIVTPNTNSSVSSFLYDLAGRRIASPTHGVTISGGKKVVK